MAQVVEHLPNKYEVMSSDCSTKKQKQKNTLNPKDRITMWLSDPITEYLPRGFEIFLQWNVCTFMFTAAYEQ
jgi:hypothetical protein